MAPARLRDTRRGAGGSSALALAAGTLAFGALYGAPRGAGEQIGPVAALAMTWREFATLLRYNLVELPWEACLMRPDRVPAASSRPAA